MGCGPVFWGITGLAGAIIAVTLAIGLPFLVNYLVDEVWTNELTFFFSFVWSNI